MDIARCSLDGRIYTAVAFAALPRHVLERNRQHLICPECNAPAFFRKTSRSGQAACFGARPHGERCSLAAQESEQIVGGQDTAVAILENPGERIVVDLAYGAQPGDAHADPLQGQGEGGRVPRHVSGIARPDASMHRRLSTLLRKLVEAPDFSQSRQILQIEGQPEVRVCDFFVPLRNVNESMGGLFRGWWGTIISARDGSDGSLWLNSGEDEAMSLCIRTEARRATLDRFRVTANEQLAQAHVLVIGELRVSRSTKPYCLVQSPNHIAIRRR